MIHVGSILGPYGNQSIAFESDGGRIQGWATDPDDADSRRLPLRGELRNGIIGFHVFEPPLRITYRGTVTVEGDTLLLEGDGSSAGQWAGEVVATEVPQDELDALRELAAEASEDDLEVPAAAGSAVDGAPDEDESSEVTDRSAEADDERRREQLERMRAKQAERRRRIEREGKERERDRAEEQARRDRKQGLVDERRKRAAAAQADATRPRVDDVVDPARVLAPGGGTSPAILERIRARRARIAPTGFTAIPMVVKPTLRASTPSPATGSISLTATGSRADQATMFTVFLSSAALPEGGRSGRFEGGRVSFGSLPAGPYTVSIDSKADMPWGPQPGHVQLTLGDGQQVSRSITF